MYPVFLVNQAQLTPECTQEVFIGATNDSHFKQITFSNTTILS